MDKVLNIGEKTEFATAGPLSQRTRRWSRILHKLFEPPKLFPTPINGACNTVYIKLCADSYGVSSNTILAKKNNKHY